MAVEARAPPGLHREKIAALRETQEASRAPTMALPARGIEMMVTPVATQKVAGAAPTAAEAVAPPGHDDKEMTTPVSAQEAAEASPMAVEVRTSIMKICRRRETSVAAQKEVGVVGS